MNPDLTSITHALDRLVAVLHKGTWDYISTFAIVLTLIVLIWYTIETYKLRTAAQEQTKETGNLLKEAQRQNEVTAQLLKEAQRQNEVSVMPGLAVINEPPSDGDKGRIVLTNVGSGPAFNLSIDRHEWESGDLLIEHDGNIMTAGQTNELRFHFQEQKGGTILDVNTLYEWINTERIPDPLKVVVRCRSVNSIEYAFTFNCTPDAGRLKVTFEGMESVRSNT